MKCMQLLYTPGTRVVERTHWSDAQVQVHQHPCSRLLQSFLLTRWTSFTSLTGLGRITLTSTAAFSLPCETTVSNTHTTLTTITTNFSTIVAATRCANVIVDFHSREVVIIFKRSPAIVTLEVVVCAPVEFIKLQELLHSLGGDPGLHESVDDPGECIQGANQNVEQSHTCEHLGREMRNSSFTTRITNQLFV